MHPDVKQIAPEVFLVRTKLGFENLISRFAKETIFGDPPEYPSSYPCVVFLYVKYAGGDDYIVSHAVPVSVMLEAIKDAGPN